MGTSKLEIVLDQEQHWDRQRRCWRLPSYLDGRVKSGALWVQGDQLSSDSFRIEGPRLKLLRDDIEISETTKVVSELDVVNPEPSERLRGQVVLAVIGLVPAILTFIISYLTLRTATGGSDSAQQMIEAQKRIEGRLSSNSGYQRKVYPELGFGFVAPQAWRVDDLAARFNVPDINVVQRNTEAKATIGIKYRLIPVAPAYVNDISAEVANQAHVFEKMDDELEVTDVTVSGFQGKRFAYKQATGRRTGKIWRYWVRMVPEVKLEIIAFTYTDEPDREEFWKEAERIIDSTVIDRVLIEARRDEV